MSTRKRAIAAALMSACVGTSLVAVAAPAAQAAPRKACVNKKSGELRILLKSGKKCKKGWTKVSWNQTGATGPAGSSGGAGPVAVVQVKDASGAAIGHSLLDVYTGIAPAILVYTEGGAYTYSLATGKVKSSGGVYYTDAVCSPSTAVTSIWSTPEYLAALNSFARVVDRPNDLVPARAFKGTSVVRAVTPTDQFWRLDSTNACVPIWTGMDTLAVLSQVATPADRPGPLSIG